MWNLNRLHQLGLTTVLASIAILAGCSAVPTAHMSGATQIQRLAEENWTLQALPTKRNTLFTISTDRATGAKVVTAQADSSASLLRRKVLVYPQDLSALTFAWKVSNLIDGADMAVRESEDAVVRVILSFDGDRTKLSPKTRMLSELSLALTGEDLPYATLMYVWCNRRQVGEVIHNPRTDRIRKLVVESGSGRLGGWLTYERDIRADFIRAFGEEPGALTGIALMTDTDNTQSKATAWYGPVSLKPLSTQPSR